ncbi:MAG TPA: hypothetical protein VFU21_04325 [Kofleriaceae bacterium]|nr:hypothetical protein [Kofleriaceae bacterium]
MPREGIERIILKLEGGEKQLSRRVVPGWEIGSTDTFTQRLFLASPRGTYLAWADSRGDLHLRAGKGRERVIKGVGGRDARFSADERWLATSRSDGTATDFDIVVVDTASGDRRVIGSTGRPEWMEWVKDGVVVSHVVSGDEIAITYLPLDRGEPVVVASGKPADLSTRFTTARLGHRAMYFFQKRAFVVDVRSPDADAREVGQLPSAVDNVEMAPDGSEAALVLSGSGVHRWKDGGELTQVGTEAAHTVWYSADGAMLAWASSDKAVVLAGGSKHELTAPEYDLNAMRFRGAELVVSMGSRALLWNPATGAKNVIGRSPKGQTVQAADVYQGGVVVWTREIRRTDRRRAQQNAAPEPFALAD